MTTLAPATAALLVLAVPLALVPFQRSPRREDRDLFNPGKLFLIYLLLQLSFSGLITLFVGQLLPYGPNPAANDAVYFRSSALTLLTIVGFHAGYWRIAPGAIRLPVTALSAWDERRQKNLAAFLFGLGYLAAAALVIVSGGLSALLESREEFRSGGLAGKGYLLFPMSSGLGLAALLTIDLVVRRRPSTTRSVTLAAIVLAAMLPSILTGFRGLILMPFAFFALYFHRNVRSLVTIRGAAFSVVLAVVFTGYGVWRAFPPGIDPIKAAQAVAETEPALFFGPFTRSAGLEVVTQVVRGMDADPRIENEWFATGVLEAATIWVPAGLWEDKPESTTLRSGEIFFIDDLRRERGTDWENPGGISLTAVGWGYWQGNVLGVLLAGALFGWIHRRLVVSESAYRTRPAVRIGYAFLAPAFILAAESPQNYLNSSVLNLGVIAAAGLWMARRRPPRVLSGYVSNR